MQSYEKVSEYANRKALQAPSGPAGLLSDALGLDRVHSVKHVAGSELTQSAQRGWARGAPPVDSALRAREPAYGNFLPLAGEEVTTVARWGGWKPPFHGLRSDPPWSPGSLV